MSPADARMVCEAIATLRGIVQASTGRVAAPTLQLVRAERRKHDCPRCEDGETERRRAVVVAH